MDQPKVEESVLPIIQISLPSSVSPPTIVSPGSNEDPDFSKVKSTILKKWIASNHLPKLDPVDNSSVMTPDSMMSEGTPSESKSPPPTTQLSVDTSFIPANGPSGSNSVSQCRACNPSHPAHPSYVDKRSTVVDEGEDPHWIKCDPCNSWYHFECVDLEPYELFLVDTFYCSACRPEHGPSKEKASVAPHRNKFDSIDEMDKPIEVGTKPWIDEFIKDEETKYGPPPSSLVTVIEVGHDFEGQFDRNAEWKNVFLIKKKAGLGIQMPEPGEMYIDQLVEILGSKRLVETIDVYRQASVQMSVGRYRELLMNSDRSRLFNILSLEFTGTKLADMVRPPSIVKELSWAERYWPDRKFGPPDTLPSGAEEACDTIHNEMRPDVELFCLMGMGGSFTDFHIDFGGSSVWYHVYKGQKIFYIVEPTKENLDIYQKHQLRTDREEYLGDSYGDKCWRVVIEEGMTLMIPAGWIHAVYTPVDSLVFGGNFLTNLNVDLQCEVNSHELRCLFESRYLYPNFEIINWYAARSFTEMLRDSNEDVSVLPMYLIRGAKALAESLTEWVERDKNSEDKTTTRTFIHGETQINILNALTKEFKKMEARLNKEQLAELELRRMNKTIKNEIKEEEEVEVKEEVVPTTPGNESIGPLKLRIPRRSETEKDKEESILTPQTPKLRIRLSDESTALPAVVQEGEERRIGGIDVVTMFSARSKSGRQKKPAAWLKEQFGDEIDREMEKEEDDEEHDVYAFAETSYSTVDTTRSEDVDYEALERAERGGAAGKKKAEKRKREKTEKASPSAPLAKERKKNSALATSKQRLADKMKNLKRH